jgi:hypothetical protein
LIEQEDRTEQRSLREATIQYIDLLPPPHRGLLQLMAKDYQKPTYALVAGAIEQLIIDWTHEVVPQDYGKHDVEELRTA